MNNMSGMYQGYGVEGSAELKVTPDKNIDTQNSDCTPIYECPIERCIHRQIFHEVPHV